jgi:hypothetical protein
MSAASVRTSGRDNLPVFLIEAGNKGDSGSFCKQRLLGTIETSTHTGLRDCALLGMLAYTFARIGGRRESQGRRLLSFRETLFAPL